MLIFKNILVASGSQLSTLQSKADFHTLIKAWITLFASIWTQTLHAKQARNKTHICVAYFATRGATAHQCSLLLQVDMFINIHLKNCTSDIHFTVTLAPPWVQTKHFCTCTEYFSSPALFSLHKDPCFLQWTQGVASRSGMKAKHANGSLPFPTEALCFTTIAHGQWRISLWASKMGSG